VITLPRNLSAPGTETALNGELPSAPFRQLLRQVLEAASPGDAGRAVRIGVTACRRREGVSTVATQLAWAAAISLADDVLLVDCNPNSTDGTPGLADLLAGGELEEFVQPSPIRRLWSLSVGSTHLRKRLFIAPDRLSETLDRLAQGYQPLICDLPPIDESSGVLDVAAQLDGVLLVVEAGRTPQEQIAAAQRLLTRCRAKLLGVVLNKQRPSL
jgi:protein-tyrosine kinase